MNINTKTSRGESAPRQQRRQSTDFGEIVNTQTDMKVDENKWDQIFHNWDNPSQCAQHKKPVGCTICDRLQKGERVTRIKDGKVFGKDILFVGDVHGAIDELHELIKQNPSASAVFVLGDLGLFTTLKAAKADAKAYRIGGEQIERNIDRLEKGEMEPFPIPVYVNKGNHDDFEHMHDGIFQDLNIHYAHSGTIIELNGIRIGVVGGILSPTKTYMDGATFKGRDKRFFTTKEIEQLQLAINVTGKIDILITHQAAKGVFASGVISADEGSEDLRKLLDFVHPIYYFHGHHHKNYENNIDGIRIKSLGNFSKNRDSHCRLDIFTKEIIP